MSSILPAKISVLGGGSWGTAIVKILTEQLKQQTGSLSKLTWWVRKQETVDFIKQHKHNPQYISSVEIHTEQVLVTCDINLAVNEADIIVLAIPSAFLAEALQSVDSTLLQQKYLVSAIKGLVPSTKQIVADFLITHHGCKKEKLMVISGPCHAEEVASEKLSYLTIAGLNADITAYMASLLSCRFIKTILSDDLTGTEYGAVLKNIYAVAGGICHGLGFGDNFQAVLISNAIREMEAFLYKVHAHPREINHSAYLGDLLVTAYSQHSRNRTFGNMIGKGYSVKSAQLEMNMIAEGYYATKSMYEWNQESLHIDMPIAEAVYNIIYLQHPVRATIEKLTAKLI
ncbi:MAG: NAD(P)H-dependent glycerol-3-phosphate dehydrogenase [Bacteroidia bacterium]|jgi:glycerol-3-phosphate dehydrogenase (NAD(P)+)|nr:NAD(P)H-dependent glycerol-3-phosphate dehydrogenase [Bacteroidia bacterium]